MSEQINYEFRPSSYWVNNEPSDAILKGIRGERRRQLLTMIYEGGSLDILPDGILQDQLSTEDRRSWAAINPTYMGGEYLPPLKAGEEPIARVKLASVLWDITEVCARLEDGVIRYQVYDEYESVFSGFKETSLLPLTLGELIELIETALSHIYDPPSAGLVWHFLEWPILEDGDNYATRKEMEYFVTVTSPFYPELGTHYEQVISRWVETGEWESVPR